MELLYLKTGNLTEEFKSIENSSFNFHPLYWVSYDDTTLTLKCEEREFPEGFFGEYFNAFSCIIGNNGWGKTSLLKFICLHLFSLKYNYIAVIKKGNEIYVFTTIQIESYSIPHVGSKYDLNNVITSNYGENKFGTQEAQDGLNILYYSNIIDQYGSAFNHEIYPESYNFCFRNISNNYNLFKSTDIVEYTNQNIKDFLIFYKNKSETFYEEFSDSNEKIFTFPEELTISITKNELYTLFEDNLQNDILNIVRQDLDETEDEVEKYFKGLLWSILLSYKKTNIEFEEYSRQNIEFYKRVAAFSIEEYFSENLGVSGENELENFKVALNNIIKDENVKLTGEADEPSVGLHLSTIPLREIKIKVSSNNEILQKTFNFIDTYYEVFSGLKMRFLDFNFQGISSGEFAMNSLFSGIYNGIERCSKENNSNNFILLFDEVDATFHPEWKRKVINYLNKGLPLLFDKKKNIQVIFTSHSPIVLSDMPAECVVTKGKTKPQKQTFGANIHTLYKNSFELEGGLIGEFAKEKIKSLIEFFEKKENAKKQWEEHEAKNFIKLIGEPVLQDALWELYRENFKAESEIEKRERKIKELEAEIKSIKNKNQ